MLFDVLHSVGAKRQGAELFHASLSGDGVVSR